MLMVYSFRCYEREMNILPVTLALDLIIIIIIINTTLYIVLSPAICESSLWFLWAKVGQSQVAANS